MIKYKILFVVLTLLVIGSVIMPGGVYAAGTEAVFQPDTEVRLAINPPLAAEEAYLSPVYPTYGYEFSVPEQLSITVNSDQLLAGAQLMIDALGGPYLFIAGLGLGVAILAAILAAVTRIRL